MSKYPQITVSVVIDGDEVLHLGAIDDNGVASALCPGEVEERGMATAALVEALQMVTGMRPGPMPTFSVHDRSQFADPKPPAPRPHLTLIPRDEE